MIDRVIIDSLFPVDLPEPDDWEAKYPARDIPDGAKVTRFAPSPTGSLHIGGVYTATIAKAVAQYSGGSYFVRIEDTDQSREVAGAAEPIRLEECGVSGPLVDMVKLADISRDYIAQLDSAVLADEIAHWARSYDHELASVIESERDLMIQALDVERVGVDNPRKDLAKWSEFRSTYGFFFRELFPVVRDPGDDRFGSLSPALVTVVAASFADGYFESDEQAVWFEQIRTVSAKQGFAPTPKEYKQNPDAYPGALRDAANVIRVALTGSTRSPDLHAVALALGPAEVIRRARAVGSREDGLVETVPQPGTHAR